MIGLLATQSLKTVVKMLIYTTVFNESNEIISFVILYTGVKYVYVNVKFIYIHYDITELMRDRSLSEDGAEHRQRWKLGVRNVWRGKSGRRRRRRKRRGRIRRRRIRRGRRRGRRIRRRGKGGKRKRKGGLEE
jgi:hypothetical protein